MLKAKCLECSNGKATFYFEGKTPKINEYYHLEEQTGKSLELNGLFHALFPELYYWMFNNDQFLFDDGGRPIDLRCETKWDLRELLKQKYGEGTVYKYADKDFKLCSKKDFFKIPQYVLDDFEAGNKKRIEVVLMSWRDYNEEQASRLVDIIIKLMNKLGVDTPKYKQIINYLEEKQKRELEEKNKQYTNKVKDKFNGTIEG